MLEIVTQKKSTDLAGSFELFDMLTYLSIKFGNSDFIC